MMQLIKECPGCGIGLSRDQLIHSPDIELVGMNVDSFDGRVNYYHFKHLAPGCYTVFRMSVMEFVDLIPESLPSRINFGQKSCEKHCLDLGDHQSCSQRCRWSPFRRFMSALLSRPAGSEEDAGEVFGTEDLDRTLPKWSG